MKYSVAETSDALALMEKHRAGEGGEIGAALVVVGWTGAGNSRPWKSPSCSQPRCASSSARFDGRKGGGRDVRFGGQRQA